MELELRQEQQLSMRQLHSLRLLQMGRLEIREYLETVAQENPTVELELPHEEEPLTRQAERWLDRWRWLEENDRQNSYYERPNQEEEDSPMNRIGTDGGLAETLESVLCRQIAGLEVPERQRQLNAELRLLDRGIKERRCAYIRENPSSPLSAYYFTCQPFPIEEVVEYYSMLSESLREGRYAPILNFVCEMYQRILNA